MTFEEAVKLAKYPAPILPVKTVSTLNVREHWAKRAARAKLQRANAYHYLIRNIGTARPKLPITVTITRIAPRKLDDDNLAGACKSIRDGVADYFQTDDRNPHIAWKYGQKKGGVGEYGVIIEIESKPDLSLVGQLT